MRTREELNLYLGRLLNPLLPMVQNNVGNRLRNGHSSILQPGHMASYGQTAIRCEVFSRILWGLAPALAQDLPKDPEYLDKGLKGLVGLYDEEHWQEQCARIFQRGCDPCDPDYWGQTVPDRPDQRYVEMCAMAYSFLVAAEKLWKSLYPSTQENIFGWLSQINQRDCSVADNNWRFFRIFVNAFFQRYGGPFDAEQYRKDIAEIDSMYLGAGWYSDGHSNQRDYYIPMAMHFYALLHSALIEHNQSYIDRARVFARDFLAWFDNEGAALPFGRSLTYRFAQGSFWAAFILANCCSEDSVNLAEAKGLLMRHLRFWMNKPEIYDNAGVLTVGYQYTNLYMSESYNAQGSPYWAQKIFAILLLPTSHPFWSSPEAVLPAHKENHQQEHARMLLQRNRQGYVRCLNAGQWAGFEPNHTREKYTKFSYSTLLGFNVSLQAEGLERYAADSMLSFSRDQQFWAHRAQTENHQVQHDGVASSCQPINAVSVRSLIYALNASYHLRVHKITATEHIYFMEAAYSLPFDYIENPAIHQSVTDTGRAFAESTYRGKTIFSAVIALNYQGLGNVIHCCPNMNILGPHSVIPVITGELATGQHLLISICGGDLQENYCSVNTSYKIENNNLILDFQGYIYRISLKKWRLS